MIDEPKRTDPRGLVVTALGGIGRGAIPIVAGLYGTGALGAGLLVVGPVVLGVLALSLALSFLHWSRLTYTTGPDNIRVEKGVLSRHARAVPYERIQDVSLEQKLLPRLFALAEVRFETGAGGKDEITLAYLSLDEADRLRELVRERRAEALPSAPAASDPASESPPVAPVLFAMGPRRVLTFGLFEFSLVIFAVLLGAAQQFDFLLPFDVWDWGEWRAFAGSHRSDFAFIEAGGRLGAALAVAGGVLAVAGLGVVTGVARTLAREYGFVLERTAKGFRRRRGLFTRTDVVMPVNRVQAVQVRTGVVRYRFGWHGLHFVSLASDSGSASHAVAPFAQMDEIGPVVAEAGFHLPRAGPEWQRASAAYRFDRALLQAVPLTVGAGVAATLGFTAASAALGVLALIAALHEYWRWRHDRYALDEEQIYVRRGWLAPRLDLVSRVKLQSVELALGPLARRRGYCTLHFGIAGGTLSIGGMPILRARKLAGAVLESAAAVDFAQLPR